VTVADNRTSHHSYTKHGLLLQMYTFYNTYVPDWIRPEGNGTSYTRFIYLLHTTTTCFGQISWSFLIIKPTWRTNFSNLFLEWNSTCFRQFHCPIIKSLSLYKQQWYMSYSITDSLRAGSGSCSQAVSKPVWHIPLLCVQWKTPNDGLRNCPKHVEFQFKNKFEKLVRQVGFIIRNLSRCTVTWTSNSSNLYVHKYKCLITNHYSTERHTTH